MVVKAYEHISSQVIVLKYNICHSEVPEGVLCHNCHKDGEKDCQKDVGCMSNLGISIPQR